MDYLQKKSIRSVAAAITGFLRHSVRKIGITREKLPSCIALAVCPLVTFYLFEMYTHNPFTTMHFKTQLLNMAFYVLTALLLFGIVKYVRAALMLQTAFFMVVGLANYYVLNFRSAPIMPWDIYSISTAASVAGNFNYELSTSTILVIVGFLILLLIESRFHMKAPGRVAKRAALILLSIALIYGYTGMIQSESFVQSFGLYDKLFTPTVMNKRDGNIVAFLMEMEYLDVEKPADYSADGTGSNYEQAGKDSAGLAAAVEDPESVKRPNIIVIMDEAFSDLADLKKQIAGIKDDIRKLGDVNVNAIEDYKEISERYGFLKGQHDDLIEAEKTLVGIIEELDTGMRKQFMEKFAEIQREFDKVFKELFGGGKGTLELVEDEDILECGIRIIAQPPGKKLQNMMQMSGGEKSLTAISLLFAIQNLKPSPFCLLDEIEAALDDSNVGRFAKYLHKLTKSTQFIVITHRRGTMAAADRLYGITMQEKGVSTLVSVNLIDDDLSS